MSAAARGGRAMLNKVANSSILAIEDLKKNIDAAAFARAVEMLDGAGSIHVVGCRSASWVAAYLFYGLTELGCRCYRIDSPGNAARRNISFLGTNDLLLAVCFSNDDDSAVGAAEAARKREVPVLAFAHSPEHPLAVASDHFIAVPVSPERRYQPWAVRMVFAQALLGALEALRARH